MDRDSYIEVTISEDAMSAKGVFYPAQGEGRPLSPDYLESVLEARGIVHGVRREELGEMMFAINTGNRVRTEVVVAVGDAPVPARPAYFEPIKQGRPDHQGKRNETKRINYKDVTRLPVVHRKQHLARLVPEQEGEPGYNVRGEEIPYPTVPVEDLRPGDNTTIEDDRIVAKIGGQLQVKDGMVTVQDHLEIAGDVGYETGSIEFPGNVVLKGEVKDGFHVWAGGSITAKTTVDVSEMYCRKEFSTSGGIVGRGKALLRCGDRVQGRFIGNCTVESKSSIFVKQYIYHSHVGCLGRLAMGNRGRIIGGSVTVVEGLRCYILGNPSQVPTTVRAGVNFIVERKLKHCREKHQSLTLKLQKLTAALPEEPSDRQLDILHKIENTRNALVMEMGDLAGELDRYEQAEVIVDGDIYPGVQIQICRATYHITQPMKKTRFSLEKESGRVRAEPVTQ